MEKKIIRQRIRMMRTAMREMRIDYYLVPTADFHNSEYVNDYFKAREFLSGFTGSNGTLVISQEEAGLWTDGRYYVQAQRELEGTEIRLFRMNEEGVPDIPAYLCQHMWEGQSLGFDGRVVDAGFGKRLEAALSEKRIRFAYERDVVDTIWQERPAFPCSRAEIVPERYCGESVREKLSRVREKMRAHRASCFFLSRLDDLMWLFNLRGSDVACNPVLMSYGFITESDAWLFLQAQSLHRETIDSMRDSQVQIRDYRVILPFLREYLFGGNGSVSAGGYGSGRGGARNRGLLLCDSRNISYSMYRLFREYGNYVERSNPTELMKAVKTDTELEFIRKIYLKDSVAVTKFIYWIKNAVNGQMAEDQTAEDQAADSQPMDSQSLESGDQETPACRLTEYTAAQYLDDLRRAIPEFLDSSFPTISAYMENAAMMHYEADPQACSQLEARGMLLVDSGGQYLGGTTDVTRTIVLGELSQEMKEHYTAVATGMLRLARAQFLHGCTGRNLDILARSPLWDRGLDYKCGTGHGIGYMLNVHEGPHNIRWKYQEGIPETVLEEGMLVTDEPGVYLEGKYGIRIENVLEIRKSLKNEEGQFMQFAPLTWVPLDLDGILPEQMPEQERLALNAYHRDVREKLSPYLTEEENAWLETATREI